MAVLDDVLRQTLTNDATLAALLTGGVLDASLLPFDEGGVASVPRDSDGVTALPFAVVRWAESTSSGPSAVQGELGMVEIYFYQDTGHDVIDQAVSQVKALINRKEMAASDRQLAYFEYGMTSREFPAQEFGGLSCKFSRYAITQVR